MGINLRYPGIFLFGVLIIALVCLAAFLLRRRRRDRIRIRAANTDRLKMHPLYQRKLVQARIFRILAAAGIILALAASVLLSSRPYRRDAVRDPVTRRDIFLCVDLSSSSYAGVKDLVNEFGRTIDGLDGDRIGISLFNTSSIQYVPMTDDYVFARERLDALAGYLSAEEEFMADYVQKYDSVYDIPESERPRYDELNGILSTFDEGITAGYEFKGTSAVGEGLASCLFSFPELNKEKRTRIILFVTDNHEELLEDPLVTLEESAEMCAQDKVTVFGIYPAGRQAAQGSAESRGSADGSTASEEMRRMKSAVELTGGSFYETGSSITAEQILDDIASQAIVDTNTAVASLDQDTPLFWVCLLTAGFILIAGTTLFYVLRRGIRKGSFSRKLTAAVLLGLMAVSIIVIAVRPMYLSPSAEIMTRNLDVAFVVDTTISMWAEDHKIQLPTQPGSGLPGSRTNSSVPQTRMDGVKKDIYSIMNALPGSNFSLIRFDNGAEIMTPFTQDINAVYDMVNDLSMPAYATARGSTLNTAHDALKAILESAGRKGRNRKTIVFIFSDGETTDGSDLMSFADLNGMIDDGAVLGYGTAEGGEMYYPGRGYVKNTTTGQNALSCIDEKSLRAIADDLDLTYINETRDSLSLEGLKGTSLGGRLRLIRMMSRDAAFANGDRAGYEETYHYFAAAAGLVLLIWLFLTIYRGGVA